MHVVGKRRAAWTLLIGASLSALAPHVAAAQTTPNDTADRATGTSPDDNRDRENEVVVTAQRREQRLLDVPISITAVSADEIAARNVSRLTDFQYAVPGLSLIDAGPGTERVQLRGVSQFVGAPTVGTYLDEFSVNPQAAGGGLDIRLLDIERIEVLRGPQPTLYGEGSIGGTIRYITANPDLNKLVVKGSGEVGFIDRGGTSYRGDGAVSIPIVADTLAIRVSGQYSKDAGWIDTPAGKDQNDSRTWVVRGKLLFEPTTNFKVTVLGQHQKIEQDDKSFGFANRTDTSVLPDTTRSNYDIANLVATYNFGPATLTASSGYLENDGFGDSDLTYFLTKFLGFPLVSGTRTYSNFRRYSQEARIASNPSQKLRYLLGAVYTDDRQDASSLSYSPTVNPGRPAVPQQRTVSRALSIYGELGYDFGALEVTGGGRYFRDRRRFLTPPTLVGKATFDSFNPRLNVSLKTGSGQVYAAAGKGFRSGGFNQPSIVPPAPASFGPENFWSYEVGTKHELLDRTLSVDAAIYYSTWKDIQAVTPIGLNPIVLGIANSGRAAGWGGEFAFTARPSRQLTITGSFAYAGLEYTSGIATHRAGDPLDGVPRYTTSVSVDYRQPIRDGLTAFARADLGFTSGSQITVRNFAFQTVGTADPAVGVIDTRTVINLRAGLDVDRINVFGFVNNLTNDYGALFAGATIYNERPIRPQPRTIGVGASASF